MSKHDVYQAKIDIFINGIHGNMDISHDVFTILVVYLDLKSIKHLSQTCKLMHQRCKKFMLTHIYQTDFLEVQVGHVRQMDLEIKALERKVRKLQDSRDYAVDTIHKYRKFKGKCPDCYIARDYGFPQLDVLEDFLSRETLVEETRLYIKHPKSISQVIETMSKYGMIRTRPTKKEESDRPGQMVFVSTEHPWRKYWSGCRICSSLYHTVYRCPKRSFKIPSQMKDSKSRTCYKCGRKGHVSWKCRKR